MLVSGGRIKRFRTYPTGELFALLSERSLLRHTIGGKGTDELALRAAVASVLDSPEQWPARCFELRAEDLLHGLDGVAARSRLAGILIGCELAGALKEFAGGRRVALVGGGPTIADYLTAFEVAGIRGGVYDPVALTLHGLAIGMDSRG